MGNQSATLSRSKFLAARRRAGLPRLTTACSGRRFAPPLILGVRRILGMISWRRKGMSALAMCLAGCSSQRPVAASVDSEEAHRAQIAVTAPAGSFRASLAPGLSLAGGDTLLTAALEREADVEQRLSALRSRAASPDYPKVGDVVLVDVSSYDEAQVLIERVNTFGVLHSRAGVTWRVRDRWTRKLVGIQLSESSWSRAPKGVYRLRTTGEVVGRPEYYVQIEQYASLPAAGRIIGRVVPH